MSAGESLERLPERRETAGLTSVDIVDPSEKSPDKALLEKVTRSFFQKVLFVSCCMYIGSTVVVLAEET